MKILLNKLVEIEYIMKILLNELVEIVYLYYDDFIERISRNSIFI